MTLVMNHQMTLEGEDTNVEYFQAWRQNKRSHFLPSRNPKMLVDTVHTAGF